MIKKHIILIGISVSLLLLVIAAYYYPGGSQSNPNSVGYDWKNNYLCNLFSDKAVNGLNNSSRLWAVCGMFFLSVSFAIFFWQFSKKIPAKGAAMVIKYVGAGSMIFAFLIVTPYHDIMVAVSGTGALIAMFYITVFLFRSKLFFMKILSIICLLVFYSCNYTYYTRSYLELLPVMQKMLLLVTIILVLSLEYFTKKEEFQSSKSSNLNTPEK